MHPCAPCSTKHRVSKLRPLQHSVLLPPVQHSMTTATGNRLSAKRRLPIVMTMLSPQAVNSSRWLLDTLAERLRRRPAKPMGSPRVGSNPTGVVSHCMPESLVNPSFRFRASPSRRLSHPLVLSSSRASSGTCIVHAANAQNSATGTRTRVARVRAEYPNQLDYSGFWQSRDA